MPLLTNGLMIAISRFWPCRFVSTQLISNKNGSQASSKCGFREDLIISTLWTTSSNTEHCFYEWVPIFFVMRMRTKMHMHTRGHVGTAIPMPVVSFTLTSVTMCPLRK